MSGLLTLRDHIRHVVDMRESRPSQRPKLRPPSETTLHLSALLVEEVAGWPQVAVRPMFGMRALYRGTAIFALLPDKRALDSPTAIAYKLPGPEVKEGRKWRLFELQDEQQVGKALAQLEQAYRKAAPAPK